MWQSTGYGSGPMIAVYTNTGTVTTAPFVDSTITATYYQNTYTSAMKAMPNGGFLICCQNGSYVSIRAYTATATGVFAWITLSSPACASVSNLADIAVRSDSSWLVAYPTTSAATINYAIYSATGTAIVSSTTFVSTNANPSTVINSVSCTCLSDGTTFVLGYAAYNPSSYFTSFFRFLPTGNTLGSEFYIPSSNYGYPYGLSQPYQRIEALASGNFVIVGSTNFITSGGHCLCYSVFNSSGTCISLTKSGTASTQAIPRSVSGTAGIGVSSFTYSIVETSGYFYIFYPSGSYNDTYASGQNAVQINETTWAPVISVSTTQSFGTASIAPSAWSASGTTPTELTYTSAGGSYTGNATVGTLTVAPTVITSSSCQDMCSTTLANGNLLFIVYLSGQIIGYTYSPTGVFVRQDTLISTNVWSGSSLGSIQICALTSGKFVITYIPTSNTSSINIVVFSSSYTQVGSTVNQTCYTTPYNNYAVSISTMPNDRFVLGYQISGTGQSAFKVFDSSLSNVFFSGNISGSNVYNVNVIANSNSTIFITYVTSSNVMSYYMYYATTSTSWTYLGNSTFSTVHYTLTTIRGVSSPNGFFYLPYINSSSQIGNAQVFSDGLSNLNNIVTANATTAYAYNNFAIGVTSQGTFVEVNVSSGTTYLRYGYGYSSLGSTALSASIVPQTGSSGAAMTITPAYGYNFALAYLNASNYPTFSIIVGISGVDFATVSSSTPSSGIPIYPIATTATSPAVTGMILAGVAVTPASAGGTGQIQTSGFAKLNSNYPSTGSVAFDSTGQAVQGVRGIANGQNIIITGNT
jgi:hypothetical protein